MKYLITAVLLALLTGCGELKAQENNIRFTIRSINAIDTFFTTTKTPVYDTIPCHMLVGDTRWATMQPFQFKGFSVKIKLMQHGVVDWRHVKYLNQNKGDLREWHLVWMSTEKQVNSK